MGSPYLNSGETIVLTTNRVVVDAIAHDMMLTTARIFFIDNRNPRFEPWEIPLSALLSVQGGKTPANDPVIIIQFRPEEGGGDTRRPLNLIFSQNTGEDRKPERDEWVRTIIQVSITWQEKRIAREAPPEPEPSGDRGLQPAVRRWVAPDRVRPLSNVGHSLPETPASEPVIPEEVEGGGVIPVSAPVMQAQTGEFPAREQEPVPAPAPDASTRYPDELLYRKSLPPRGRVIIPQIIEELLPGGKEPLTHASNEGTGTDRHTPEQAGGDISASPEISVESPQEQPPETMAVTLPESALVPETTTAESTPEEKPLSAPQEPAEEPAGPECPSGAESALHSENIAGLSGPAEEAGGLPATGAIPERDPETVEPAISSSDAITASMEPAVTESVEAEKKLSQPPKESSVTGRDMTPKTATLIIFPERSELQPEESPEKDKTEIFGSDSVTTDEDTGQKSAAPQLPETLQSAMPGVAGPADFTGVSPSTAEPSSPEITPAPLPEFPGSTESHSSGKAAMEQAVSPAAGSPAAGIPPEGPPLLPAPQNAPGRTVTYVVVILLIVALVAAGIMLSLPQVLSGNPVNAPAVTVPVPTPEMVNPATPAVTPITSPPAPSVTPLTAPTDGVWVKINSTAQYLGRAGNPEQMRQFAGSGENFYKVPRSDRPVQVSVQKQDNSGAQLTVGIYRNGTLISTRSVTMPMGTIDLLIDPVTARAPGLTENDTVSGHAVGRIENY